MDDSEAETWDLVAVRNYIDSTPDYAPQKKKDLIQIVDSVDFSIQLFRYHGAMIYKEMDAVFKNKNIGELERFLMIAGMSKQQSIYEGSRIACEANFISCVHTVRNMYDVFSHLINHLILNSSITEKCDLYKVINILPASPLRADLENLKNSDRFKYVAAFSNTVKHNVLIRSMPRVSLLEKRSELHIDSFEYSGKKYDSCWMMDVLIEVQETLNAIIQCGQTFNKHLFKRA